MKSKNTMIMRMVRLMRIVARKGANDFITPEDLERMLRLADRGEQEASRE